MNREELEQELDEVRERLLLAVDPLPDEALTQPGTCGSWSVADVLAHLTVWEAELVTALMYARDGRQPRRILQALANRDHYNAQRHVENQGRDLDRIFDDLFQVRRQLERWLERFKNNELTREGYFKWLPERSLAQFVAANSCEHEAAHLPDLEAFAGPWLEESEDHAVAPPTIGLADIEVLSHDDPT